MNPFKAFLPILFVAAIATPAAQQRPPQAIAADLERLAAELKAALGAVDPIVVKVADVTGLEAAVKSIPKGGRVELAPGVYRVNLVIGQSLTLTTAGSPVGERRAVDADRGKLAQLLALNGQPALEVLAGDVTVTQLAAAGPSNDIIVTGAGVRGVSYDRLLVEGDPTQGAKRGIRLDGANVSVTRSTIKGIRRIGQDSQAVAGWNGPGPYAIHDNHLEAASENILFGGADPEVVGTIPTDISITNNLITKPLEWCNKGWVLKNLLELKSARKVVIRGNVMRGNCRDGQDGWALVFTPRNQDGTHPAAAVEDVLVEDNVIAGSPRGIQLYREPELILRRLVFRNNLFDLTATSGRSVDLLGGMEAIALEQNTFRIKAGGEQSLLYQYDGAVTGFRFTGNLVTNAGEYGICAQGNCEGREWKQYLPGAVIEGNAVGGFPIPANLPGNLHLSLAQVTVDADGYGIGAVAAYGRKR